MLWMQRKTSGVDTASQQVYFIVSGSPSKPILGGGDQICFECKERPLGQLVLTNSICPAFKKDKFRPSKFVLHA